jgi:hypothetical protein
MGVKKYRSVSEMPGRQALPPLDPDNLWRFLELCELTDSLFPVHREPGVRKFRSLEEASRHRQEWEAAAVRKRGASSASGASRTASDASGPQAKR